MKTLGQIAWEAAQITATKNWDEVDEWTQEQFNIIAEAVSRAIARPSNRPQAPILMSEQVELAAEQSGFKRIKSCCDVPQKFCNSDLWQGELRAFGGALLRIVSPATAEASQPVSGAVDERFTLAKRDAINWLKKHYPVLCVKSGLCEKIGGSLYTISALSSNQVNAAQPESKQSCIIDWYTPKEIMGRIASNDYSPELLLQHAMHWLDVQPEKDAERLDYISSEWFYIDESGEISFNYIETWTAGKHANLRAAIDAAISKQSGK